MDQFASGRFTTRVLPRCNFNVISSASKIRTSYLGQNLRGRLNPATPEVGRKVLAHFGPIGAGRFRHLAATMLRRPQSCFFFFVFYFLTPCWPPYLGPRQLGQRAPLTSYRFCRLVVRNLIYVHPSHQGGDMPWVMQFRNANFSRSRASWRTATTVLISRDTKEQPPKTHWRRPPREKKNRSCRP